MTEHGLTLTLFYWLKDKNGMAQMVDGAKKMQEIEVVKSLRVGTSLHMGDDIMDETYDLAVIMTLGSAEDFPKAFSSEEHMAFGGLCRQFVDKVQGYSVEF